MSTATFPSRWGYAMGWLVDRQFEVCEVCGGKVQVDTSSEPGETEESGPKLTYVKSHIGSCSPPRDESATESYP